MELVIDPDELLDSLGPAIEKEWMLRVRDGRLLEGGMNSVTFAFDSHDGGYVAKWVPHRDGPALRNGTLAARLMERSGIRAGKPRLTIDHRSTAAVEGGDVALLEFVPGMPLSSRDEDQVDWGGTLGRVHTAGVQPADGTFFSWVEHDGKNDAHPSWVRVATEAVVTELKRLPALTWVQLHTDPAPEAFLRDDQGQIGVIDWAGSTPGPALYDVASAVMYAGGESRASTFLRSYLEHSPVGEDEVQRHLPTFRRFRAVVQAVYFSTRVQEENMLGGSGMLGNAQGLSDARHMLDELGDHGNRHPAEQGR
jgi:Ser/Thr protein kinase RdoA (MazF antagonist)